MESSDTAMMDISDGPSSELMHICEQSHCGCRVYEKNIPIDYQDSRTGRGIQHEPHHLCDEWRRRLRTSLHGSYRRPRRKSRQMEGVKQIGYITKESLGKFLITRDGQEFELKAQGWNPFERLGPLFFS